MVLKTFPECFLGFVGNLRAQKPNKAQTKVSKPSRCEAFLWVYQQVVVSTLSFIIYPLFIYFLKSCTNLTFLFRLHLRHRWSMQPGIRKIHTLSPLTAYESLATAQSIHQPPCFRRRICHCTYHCLRQRTPFFPTSDICCRHCQ